MSGFPLRVGTYKGNKEETQTMPPMIEAFTAAYSLERITVVAGKGMFLSRNKTVIVEVGLDHFRATKVPQLPVRVVWALKKYRSIELGAGDTTVHVTMPLPPEVQNLVDTIMNP
ncbi:hypothetical protein PAB09_10765 [Corynebacterium sp. SCR221107]|uniref:hypothetical protein n=1 Tax=Corynebacterium sp. SCR221107 TaxID=3017361 RepID=UPI0022EC496B|nr:hypothetical protein [Corynebacterium sp. SCR221107]WBT08347.1 hypothetical protein PAB09_10765 [Corynebacterium sp. SCR221107]